MGTWDHGLLDDDTALDGQLQLQAYDLAPPRRLW